MSAPGGPLLTESELERLVADPRQREDRYRELVRSHYAGATDLYRHVWGDSFHFAVWTDPSGADGAVRHTERRIADIGGFRPGDRVLDVGCGIGGPALAIAEHSGSAVTGIDLLERHVEIAAARAADAGLGDRASFLHADAMAMPFADAAFDHVYTFEAGCHTPDTAGFVRECARVLRPGGSFVGTDWLKATGLDDQADERWLELVCRGFALPHLVDAGRLGACLQAAGLQVRVLETVPARAERTLAWEPAQEELLRGRSAAGDAPVPPGVRRMAHGARAFAAAAEAGALVVGFWHAVRPVAG